MQKEETQSLSLSLYFSLSLKRMVFIFDLEEGGIVHTNFFLQQLQLPRKLRQQSPRMWQQSPRM